jgi:hypothetical protein
MKKLLLIGAFVAILAALLPVAAVASPGNSTNYREDGWQSCYYNGHGYVVYKDDSATCF